ncbi:MAG: hypothetical protein LBD31_09750 [Treponema sp.]|jgi:hypothetical protein|nr:hypothetical protein [Treponema sp.]
MDKDREDPRSGDAQDLDDGRVRFYYSRERRLQRASPAVRDLYEGGPVPKPGLFRTLTATKSRAFLFLSIVTLCIMLVIMSRFTGGGGILLGNNTLRFSARSSGGNSYLTLEKTALDGTAYTGAVDLGVFLPEESGKIPEDPLSMPAESRRIYFTLEKNEVFRFAVPFTGKKLLILAEVKEERALVTLNPD